MRHSIWQAARPDEPVGATYEPRAGQQADTLHAQSVHRESLREMRIAIVHKYTRSTGGADIHCLGLAKTLRERGHDVAFLSTSSSENLDDGGVFIRPSVTNDSREALSAARRADAAVRALWNPSAAAAARRLLADFEPDVVHAHKLYPQLSVAPIVVASRRRLPIVQTLHDFELFSASAVDPSGSWRDHDETRFRYRLLNEATFGVRRLIHVPRVHRFIAVSGFVADIYRKTGVEADVIANFVESDSNTTSPAGFPDREGILYFGRLRPEKGVLDVLELARKLPHIQVRIVGSGVLADRVAEAAELLPNLVATGSVPHPDIFDLVRSARIVVVPSLCAEAASNVALEAMARGTPVVAYATGGLREYVVAAGGGQVIDPDVENLARTCAELHADEKAWVEMSTRGRAAVETSHSPDAYAARVERVYEEAADAAAASGPSTMLEQTRLSPDDERV